MNTNWTPITEAMPKDESPVLTCGITRPSYSRVRVASYVSRGSRWVSYNDDPPGWIVTHWCEIPEIPSQSESSAIALDNADEKAYNGFVE